MVIIDFSHLSFRMLHTAIFLTKPKKKNGQFVTEEFKNMYQHLVFQSLLYVRKTFSDKDIIIAVDSKNNWRRKFYPEYKANRKKGREESEINFDEFFEVLNDILDNLEYFPFKKVSLDYLEADDIAGILVMQFPEKEKILITSDKDWKQLLQYKNTKMYDPIKKKFIQLEKDEKETLLINNIIEDLNVPKIKFTLRHALLGDAGDNVPGVTKETKFSDNFKKYLKENGLNINEIEFWELSEDKRNYLIDNYNVFKVIKSGKRKGEFSDEKDIWKTVPFGEKKAMKVLENEKTLENFLNTNPLYLRNFKRNLVLVDLAFIPKDLRKEVIEYIEDYKISYNSNEIKNFFIKNGLNEMFSNIHLFMDTRYENKANLTFNSNKSYNVSDFSSEFSSCENNVEISDSSFEW